MPKKKRKKKLVRIDPLECLVDLTREQVEAVKHEKGPALVVATAGSGKTRSLTRRVAYLIARGANPHRILAVTFTNKAAEEMRRRIRELVGGINAKKVWISTFHSFCAKLLRKHPDLFKVPKNFTICDEVDSKNYVDQAIAELEPVYKRRFDGKPFPEVPYVKRTISNFKLHLEYPGERDVIDGDVLGEFMQAAYYKYSGYLIKARTLDFDDLLMGVTRELRDRRKLREKFAAKFDHVLVDEYQDTNRAQFTLVKNLSVSAKSVFVIGDPMQSIYKFNGADVQNILSFEKKFRGTKTYTLSRNFRSVKAVADVANAVGSKGAEIKTVNIEVVKGAGEKARCFSFSSPPAEAGAIADEIETLVELGRAKYKDFAILYRTRAQSGFFENVFVEKNIPFKIVGSLGFFKRAIIKDVICYMRLLVNMQDDASFTRIYNRPPREIGKATFEKLCVMRELHDCSLMEILRHLHYKGHLPPRAQSAVKRLRSIFTRLRKIPKDRIEPIVQAVIKHSGYKTRLELSGKEEDLRKLGDLTALAESAKYYDMGEGGNLRQFLQWVSLMQTTDDMDERDRNRVQLMTCHASKGLEFKRVYLVGATDTKMPIIRFTDEAGNRKPKSEIKAAIEEERRLFFVAVTRAEESLTISWPATDYYGECNPSRFIKEAGDTIDHKDWSQHLIGSYSGAASRTKAQTTMVEDHGTPKRKRSHRKGPTPRKTAALRQEKREGNAHKEGRRARQFNFWS
jgi:DNA helicase-2/ATP-dependent DNA helicase PcrA